MPELVFPFHTVRLTLENGHVLGEALLFPELSRLARDDQRLDKRLKANLVAQLKGVGVANPKRKPQLFRRASCEAFCCKAMARRRLRRARELLAQIVLFGVELVGA